MLCDVPAVLDVYKRQILRNQKEPEAQRIATALEIYVHGSLNVFNHRTNVDVNNRFVCYDIRELGKQLKKLGMLIVQAQVWNRVTINRAQHKSTRYDMDEVHLLRKEEQTAAYSVEIWKRFRKWGGIQMCIRDSNGTAQSASVTPCITFWEPIRTNTPMKPCLLYTSRCV